MEKCLVVFFLMLKIAGWQFAQSSQRTWSAWGKMAGETKFHSASSESVVSRVSGLKSLVRLDAGVIEPPAMARDQSTPLPNIDCGSADNLLKSASVAGSPVWQRAQFPSVWPK